MMLLKFPGMIFVYIIALAIIILHFDNKMRSTLNSIEQRRNIADLLFLKQLLDFIYNSNVIPDIESIMSDFQITPETNVLELFKNVIPVTKNEIEEMYKPLTQFDEVKKTYDILNEKFRRLLYFNLIYGIIFITIYIIYDLKLFMLFTHVYFLFILSWAIYIMAVITSIIIISSIFSCIRKIEKKLTF